MSSPRNCPGCGLFSRPGPLARHIKRCPRLMSVEQLLEVGKVDTSGGPDACWMWNRGSTKYGKVGGDRAHRVMFQVANSVDPGELYVCHSCDRPGCVNPSHLWLGTASENTRDAVVKGRHYSPFHSLAA